MYVGILHKEILCNTGAKISRSARPICFSWQDTTRYIPTLGGWGMYLKSVWWQGGYGRISGGTRALELAMVNREATLGHGARSPSTSLVPVEPSRGEGHDMTQAGGRSQAEQRLCEAAAILTISRRRKAL
jgi:hypothetical protein